MNSGMAEFPFRMSWGQWGRWTCPPLVLKLGMRKFQCVAPGRELRREALTSTSIYCHAPQNTRSIFKNIGIWAPPHDNWIKFYGASVFVIAPQVILKGRELWEPLLAPPVVMSRGKCFSFLKTKASKSYRTFHLKVQVNVSPYLSIS